MIKSFCNRKGTEMAGQPRRHRPGRPSTALSLMPVNEIARRIGMSPQSARRALHSSMRKLEARGVLGEFMQLAAIAQLTPDEKEKEAEKDVLQCGSLECLFANGRWVR
jgi:hypothetical protein